MYKAFCNLGDNGRDHRWVQELLLNLFLFVLDSVIDLLFQVPLVGELRYDNHIVFNLVLTYTFDHIRMF